MTRPLFMQSKRANIHLPKTDNDTIIGEQIISEEVTYSHADNVSGSSQEGKKSSSISDIQQLDELVVIAKARFTPERKGKVNVNFDIHVPKELLSENWQVILSPKLLHNDSVVELNKVLLKGQLFADKQKKDVEKYDAYLASIVSSSDYDKKFLDHKKIKKDITKQQNIYWKLYNKEWKKQNKYLAWKHMMQDQYNKANLKRRTIHTNIYDKHMRLKREEAVKLSIKNKDTTGLHNRYVRKYNNHIKQLPFSKTEKELTLKKTPREYKAYFGKEIQLHEIDNYVVTEKDSLDITKHRYLKNKILKNEAKEANKELVYARMVPYPIETGMKLDTVIEPYDNFTYLYELEYPVVSGLNTIRITMDSHIKAIDQSGYTLIRPDTLSYFISSLVQLVDTTLIRNETKIYKNMYSVETLYPKFKTKQSKFLLEEQDNAKQVDELMHAYNNLINNTDLRIDSIQIKAYNLFDGPFEFDKTLVNERINSIKKQLLTHTFKDLQYADKIVTTTSANKEWGLLSQAVKDNSDIGNKESIVSILSNRMDGQEAEKQIQEQFPADYIILKEDIYPELNKIELLFNLSRPGMEVKDSIQNQYTPEYEEGIRLLQNRQYGEALEKLKNRPDYNTALCLACMGYNGRAFDLLSTLDTNANTEYLLTLVLIRMNREEEAINHLLKACELDTRKIDRASLDPEIAGLINKHKLNDKLEEIYSQVDAIDWKAINRIKEVKLNKTEQ